MQPSENICIFWFRRDLRIDDNTGLIAALNSGLPVVPLFIFDTDITDELKRDDPRISFILESLRELNGELKAKGSCILIKKGNPLEVWEKLTVVYSIKKVFFNRDYEPYAIERDKVVTAFLDKKGIGHESFKDQVIFGERDIMKPDGSPYTVFTSYKNAWLREYGKLNFLKIIPGENFHKFSSPFPSVEELGFTAGTIKIPAYDLSNILEYDKYRDYPAPDRTTHLGPYLRFGTVSVRNIVEFAKKQNQVFLGELVWREFFMQILFNFPHVANGNFRKKYDRINWRNNESEFRRWCNGETGYPIVDAGMRQMNETGYMHNRVRMITAGFLCKHLLIAWWYGEAYFAEKLVDYELSSNNGNWQWAAGTGCDAVPYFRIFNPELQQKKFDPANEYVRKWVPEAGTNNYPRPVIEHKFARQRAIEAYKAENG